MEKVLTQRNTVVLVGALLLWRLYLSAQLQLHPDEAYYWLWSRYLDFGYFDHPPLVAYFIWFTTLFSTAEFWVRLSGAVVVLVLSVLTWRLSMQLFKSIPIAAGSVMLFNVYPLTMLGLIVMTPDIPLFLFWSLSVYVFWQIMRTQQAWRWYVLGGLFGLALLSKYTAVLMVPCFLIYLGLTDERRWLKTAYPYLALLIGLFIFLPVVLWNSQHNWVSFAFQLRHGLGGDAPSLSNVATYLGGQLFITGPIILLLGLYAALAGLGRRDKETLLLLSTAVPIIVFFGLSSYWKLAGPNWPIFAYFTFSILVTRYCVGSSSKTRRAWWSLAVLSSLLLSAVLTLHARFNLLPLALYSPQLAQADATNAFYGWRELGIELKKYPGTEFAVTPSHQLSAEIIYYTHASLGAQTDRMARPSEFNLWRWPNSLHGKDGFYVWTEADAAGPYGEYFASTTRGDSLSVYRDGNAVRTYHIVLGQNGLMPVLPVTVGSR